MTARKQPTRPRRSKAGKPPAVEGVEWGSNKVAREVEWLWDQILPLGSSVIIEGRKGVGKSSVAACIAAAVTGGTEPPGWCHRPPGRVLWEAREDSWESVVIPRLKAAGARVSDCGKPNVLTQSGRYRRLQLPTDLAPLDVMMTAGNVRCLVIDPFTSAADPGLDLRSEQEARRYAEPIQELMQRHAAVCVQLRHVRKGNGHDARDAGLGSSALGNVARSVIRCAEHPHEPETYVAAVVSGNYCRERIALGYRIVDGGNGWPRIEWIGRLNLDADQIAAGRGDEADRDEWGEAERLLHALIGTGSCPVMLIQHEGEQAGVSPKMLRRAKARLGVESRRVATSDTAHWEWVVPKSGWPEGLARDDS